ncbi:MAG TPA: hypothetical protein VD930_03725 [Gemmatimonadales bacterium]|nr:hypothetical protein [Gemmatimonadales bacterium]
MNQTFHCETCGTPFVRRPCEVRQGKTRFCSMPCYRNAFKRHKHPLYHIWVGIRHRCRNPNGRDFASYGGRGIYVCPEWDHSFEQFIADMGERPSLEHTLHRVDNDGPYSPDNCVWATPLDQSLARRDNRLLTFQGETLPISVWAKRFNISAVALTYRIDAGWETEDALTRPLHRAENGWITRRKQLKT